MIVQLGRTRRRGIFQEWGPVATRTRPMPHIPEDYRWEELPTTMKTAYRTRRSRTQTRKRPIPQCGRLYGYRSKRLKRLDKHNMVCKPTKASLFVKEVEFAGHVVGHGQRRPMPGKLASLHHWEKLETISELRSFMGFCNYYSGCIRMYAELSGPLYRMLQVGNFDGWKGSKKKLAWTPEAEDAFSRLKERLLGQLGLFLVDPDKGFVLRTDASDYGVGAVLEQIRDDGSHVPVAFWSRILAEGQRRTWTARGKETYAIVCALRKWSGHIGWQPVVVCTDHQSLQSWHKEHVDTPSGPAARRARWHETFAKFDVSVV